ncbi:MAG TPA: hypothetical protein VF172_01595 [Nitrososphaera sp.]|jgi:hypothetical protein
MKEQQQQVFIVAVAVAACLLAALSVQQANAQYGDSLPVGSPTGNAISTEMLERCEDLGISRIQCNQASILQAERIELIKGSEEKGSGTSMIATDYVQMVGFVGALGAVFGGVAAGFFVMGRKKRQKLPA